ncbi:MAG: hypothetical protein JWQ10_3843 [Herbaspirillum sp.]|nr:hypothetical protein [Herbaspirillum sp.]
MKKLLPLALLSVAAFFSGTVSAAVAAPAQQPDANIPDYSVYKTCRENGGYGMQQADGSIVCVPFEAAK